MDGMKTLKQILTPREFEIAGLVAEGLKTNEIGKRMGRTQGTVKNSLRMMYDKIGCDGRIQLAARFIREQMQGEYK